MTRQQAAQNREEITCIQYAALPEYSATNAPMSSMDRNERLFASLHDIGYGD
jgi:hypothetical protein